MKTKIIRLVGLGLLALLLIGSLSAQTNDILWTDLPLIKTLPDSIITYSKNGEKSGKRVFEYNEKGYVLSTHWYSYLDDEQLSNYYEYDSNNRLIKFNEITYEWNGNQRIYYETWDAWDGESIELKVKRVSEFDDQGRLVCIKGYFLDEENGIWVEGFYKNCSITKFIYEYDGKGNNILVRWIYNYYYGPVEQDRDYRSYDEKGNITQERRETYWYIEGLEGDKDWLLGETTDYVYSYNLDNKINTMQVVGGNYSIFYPNDLQSSIDVDSSDPVTSGNKGSFDIGLNMPEGTTINEGSLELELPDGFGFDTERSGAVTDNISVGGRVIIVTNGMGSGTSFVRSTTEGNTYRKILSIAYTVDDRVKQGTYTAYLNSVNFELSDGTRIIEEQVPVSIEVTRYAVHTEDMKMNTPNVYVSGNHLIIDSKVEEAIEIYSVNGQLLHSGRKPVEAYSVNLPISKRILFVKGSSGWVRKVFID